MAETHREELLEQVTDYVLERGLIGFSLRPVAAAIGTSDRMLIYHFTSRDALVSAVGSRTNQRAIHFIRKLPAASSVRAGVNRLWLAYQEEPLSSCLNVYLQAAATGLIGREPYLTSARESDEQWVLAMRSYLIHCGAPLRRVARITTLVDSGLYGFHMDLITGKPEELARGVSDLAKAAQSLVDA